MSDSFNEKDYRQKLIKSGFSADDAAALVAKMAAARRESAVRSPTPPRATDLLGDDLLNLPPAPPAEDQRKSPEPADNAMMTPKRTVIESVAAHVNELANHMRGETMPRKSKAASAPGALSERVNEAKQRALLKTTKEQIRELQLSLFDIAPWDDDMRAMPNDWLRSALFTVRNKRTPRAMMEREPIFHVNKDVSITYTGWELRAYDDELVLHQVLEYAKRIPLGQPVTFTFYEICKDLDWSINKAYYDKAEACLTRLQASAMQFSSERIGRLESLSLIRRFRILDKGNRRTQRCQVEIDDEIVLLFAGDYYTRFVWEKYRKLSPTARRMFDYFATHKEPFPLTLDKFRLMCGSDSSRPKKWREQAGMAAEELRESGLVKSAWVDDDKVYCQR